MEKYIIVRETSDSLFLKAINSLPKGNWKLIYAVLGNTDGNSSVALFEKEG
jgi:hypothetical protein